MSIPVPEPLVVGTGAFSIIMSLVLAILLATRRAYIKDTTGAQCLRFTLRSSCEDRLIRHLQNTPRDQWTLVAHGFGITLNWCGYLRLSNNARVLLSEQHYRSVGLLIAMALATRQPNPVSNRLQRRLGAQYRKALRETGVDEFGLSSIQTALRTSLPDWNYLKVSSTTPITHLPS